MRRSPCRSSLQRQAHVTHSLTREAQAARAVGERRATATAARCPAARREPPPLPAASFLTIICVLVFYHYYSLVLFYVLSSASRSHRRPAAMRGERRPDNSLAQLPRSVASATASAISCREAELCVANKNSNTNT